MLPWRQLPAVLSLIICFMLILPILGDKTIENKNTKGADFAICEADQRLCPTFPAGPAAYSLLLFC